MSMIGRSDSVTIHGGAFAQHVASSQSQTAFEQLTKAVAPGAFHNSGERFDPPKCHPRTRLAVTERIINWILGEETTDSLILWLHGPAGSGKSAIAQRIAELCHEANRLLASFFFSKSNARRNSADHLFPTIAYQIAYALPGARTLIEQEIARDPLIFTRSLEAQMVGLIVTPLQPLIDSGFFADSSSSPRLIILDGLDEVANRQEQTRILEAISNVLRRNHIPLIFLISSRPEQEISYAFNSQSLAELTAQLLLDDTFNPGKDIRIFLDDSFSEIKAKHPQKHSIPASWPSPDSLNQLVRKSSGQFIYASIVIHFVKSIRHRPTDRLDIILGLRPVHRDLPFAELDALYMHILSALEYPDWALQIIGAIFVRKGGNKMTTMRGLEQFLGFELGDTELYLADMTSLVSWNPNGTGLVHILHASFCDFLFDSSRSGAFTIDIKAMHNLTTCHCLRHLTFASNDDLSKEYWQNDFLEYAICSIAYHLEQSSPSADLKDYLQLFSFEHLIENLRKYYNFFIQQQDSRSLRMVMFWIRSFMRSFWKNIFDFVPAMKTLGLGQSEHYNLQHRLFDQVINRELDLQHPINPSLHFLLCLRVRSDDYRRHHLAISGSLWDAAARQLTDWDSAVSQQKKSPGHLDLFSSYYNVSRWVPIILREFLQDSSRSGKYTVDAEAYASASLSCLKYLSRCHLGAPINFHHTRRNLARRRNSPWHWNRYMKAIAGQLMLKQVLEYFMFPNRFCFPKNYSLLGNFSNLDKRAEQQRKYLDATRLALVFLRRALPRSAKSDNLVAFANADKSFSPRAVLFPANLKKCKMAIATYLARVQQQSGAQSGMTGA